MTDRRRTISIASDDRARVPFAMIGVILLLSSTAIVGILQTRPESSTDANLDPQVALDRTTATAQTTLRASVREAATKAASEPVTKALSSTPAGAAIEPRSNLDGEYEIDNATFERYTRLRIYLEARRALDGTVQRVNGNVRGEISLPAVEYTSSNLSEAIGRVHITAGSETDSDDLQPGKLRARIEGVTIRATRDGSTVASKRHPITVTVASTAFAQHYRTIRYERRLNTGFLSSSGLDGFSRKFAARIYPLAYAKTYYERVRGSVTTAAAFKSVVENYEVETLANDAIFDVQESVYGTADPRASRTMTGSWLCTVAKTGSKLVASRTYRNRINTLCQATKYLFGGASGDPPRTVSEFVSRALGPQTQQGLRTAEQTLNRKRTIHISKFADPANQEMRGGAYDWEREDDDWKSQTRDGSMPNEEELDVDVNFPSVWSEARLDEVIDDVYRTRVSASTGSTTKTGSFPSVSSPGPDWSVRSSDETVRSQSTTVDHTGTAGSGTPRRLHRFDVTVTRTITKEVTYETTVTVPCPDDVEGPCTDTETDTRSDTSTVTFETSITLTGDHTVGTSIERRGVAAAYERNGSPNPSGWSDSANFRKAKRESIRQLLAVSPGSPASALEDNIDPGAIDSESAFDSQVDSQITSGSATVDTLTQSRSALKEWLKADLTRTHDLLVGDRDGVDWDPPVEQIEVSRVDLATEDRVFRRLIDRLRPQEDSLIYRDVGDAYANAPARARVQLRERYLNRVYHWIERVEEKRNEAKNAANTDIKSDFERELGDGVDVINQGLSFAQDNLDGSGSPDNPERATLPAEKTPLTGDISYQVHGSPTYLTAKPVTRDTVPAVRPMGETISDPENTLYSSFAARNHMFLPRPGLPLIPWPTYWYLSVNNLNVQVHGEYARFEVTATSGAPTAGGSTSYIRQSQPVSLTIDGLQREVGDVEAVDFENVTPIVLMTPGGTVQPTGSLGPGDIVGRRPKHSLKECTKTWAYTGADFDPQTDVTASECGNIQQANAGGLSAFQAFVPDGHQGTVETISEYVDDDDDDYGDLCHLSGSAGLALGGGVRSQAATAADGEAGCTDSELTVEFLEPGARGTSILLRRQAPDDCACEDGTVLIDTGNYGTENDLVDKLRDRDIEEIDSLILTHNHSDHIGGLILGEHTTAGRDGLLSAHERGEITIGKIYFNGVLAESSTGGLTREQGTLRDELRDVGIPRETLERGVDPSFGLGGETDVDVLNPPRTPRSGSICQERPDCNAIVFRLERDGHSFLFTSDIREGVEERILDSFGISGADVLQLAHHGGADSNGDALLGIDHDAVVFTGGERNWPPAGDVRVDEPYSTRDDDVTFVVTEDGNLKGPTEPGDTED